MALHKKFFIVPVVVGLLGIFPATIVVAQKNYSKVIAEVAGEKITAGEFMRVFRKNNPDTVFSQESLREYLDLYVNYRLKVKEAIIKGLDTTRSFREELAGYRDQLARPYMIDESATEQLVKEAFDRSRKDLRASHIMIRLDKNAPAADTLLAWEKITNVRNQLLQGKSFAEVAEDISEDQSARDRDIGGRIIPGNKGDLGYFGVFDMVYSFETAAFSLKKGEISNPVRTDYGYHLIKLTDERPALGQVLVSHILLLNPQSAADTASLRARAMMIYRKLIEGADFAELAQTYSDDRATADNGGQLQWFGVNRMIPDFIEQIYKLEKPGDFTLPFKTSFGWHIVRLIDRKRPASFGEMHTELKDRVNNDERASLVEGMIVQNIKKEYGFRENRNMLVPFYQMLTSAVFDGSWQIPAGAKLDGEMFRIGNRRVFQKEFAQYLTTNQKPEMAIDIQIYVGGRYKKFVDETLLKYKDQQLENKFPEFRALMNEYHDGILLFDLTDREVWSKAIADSTGLERYFTENQYQYKWPTRIQASVLSVPGDDTKAIGKVKELLAGEVSVSDIPAMMGQEEITLLADHKLYSKGDNSLVDQAEWKPGVYIIPGKPDATHIVIMHKVIGEQPKQLAEVRGIVTADYQNYLEKKWIAELRSKYPIKVKYGLLSALK